MDKDGLRKEIAGRKKLYTTEQLNTWSELIRKKIENLEIFRSARTVLLYHSLPGEVQTQPMLSGWQNQKTCLLPQVVENNLLLRKYNGEESLRKGTLNILEPTGELFDTWKDIDLVLVPGLAFDRRGNRLGRGKGYYDRFLCQVSAPTIGICFDFQIEKNIPINEFDVPVQRVITPELILP